MSLAEGVLLPLTANVVVRYRGTEVPARVLSRQGKVEVRFDEPVRAVVPGQVAVFYDGERMLGGGVIAETVAAELTVAA